MSLVSNTMTTISPRKVQSLCCTISPHYSCKVAPNHPEECDVSSIHRKFIPRKPNTFPPTLLARPIVFRKTNVHRLRDHHPLAVIARDTPPRLLLASDDHGLESDRVGTHPLRVVIGQSNTKRKQHKNEFLPPRKRTILPLPRLPLNDRIAKLPLAASFALSESNCLAKPLRGRCSFSIGRALGLGLWRLRGCRLFRGLCRL
jgi:hypothetical protein